MSLFLLPKKENMETFDQRHELIGYILQSFGTFLEGLQKLAVRVPNFLWHCGTEQALSDTSHFGDIAAMMRGPKEEYAECGDIDGV